MTNGTSMRQEDGSRVASQQNWYTEFQQVKTLKNKGKLESLKNTYSKPSTAGTNS